MTFRKFAFAGASALIAAGAFSASASAQGYYGAAPGYESCDHVRNGRTMGGAVAGALIGGLFGNQVSGSGARDEGTAVGAVVGALAGSAIGRQSVDCAGYAPYADPYAGAGAPAPGYGAAGYPGAAPAGPYGATTHPDYYRNDNLVNGGGSAYGGYSNAGYAPGYSTNYGSGYGSGGGSGGGAPLYGGPSSGDCSEIQQVTRLPDGRQIVESVYACRDPYTGEWVAQR